MAFSWCEVHVVRGDPSINVPSCRFHDRAVQDMPESHAGRPPPIQAAHARHPQRIRGELEKHVVMEPSIPQDVTVMDF